MGVFYSYCPNCAVRYEWFLDDSPTNCRKCNRHITTEEINASFHSHMLGEYGKMKKELHEYLGHGRWYSNHVEDMVRRFEHEHLDMYPNIHHSTLAHAYDYPEFYRYYAGKYSPKFNKTIEDHFEEDLFNV